MTNTKDTSAQQKQVFDNYEISPCTRTEEPDAPGKFYFEVCDPHDADVWTLYGHIHGEGARAIGDFDTRQHAEEVFQRSTGIPFAESREIADHLRMMHAGKNLLEELSFFLNFAVLNDDQEDEDFTRRIADAQSLVAEATGRAS